MQLKNRLSLVLELLKQACAPKRTNTLLPKERQKILVIRLDRIGDFALYLPFAAALRLKFPREKYHLTLIGNPLWMPLARKMLDFDLFLELDTQQFLTDTSYRRALLKKIATMQFSLLLQPRFYRELLTEDLIAMAAAAPDSLAFSGTARHINRQFILRPWKKPYHRLIDSNTLYHAHELEKNRLFLEEAAPGKIPIPNPWLKHSPLPKSLTELAGCIVILPGGSAPERAWPANNFGILVKEIAHLPLKIVITGTKSEQKTAQEVMDFAKIPIVNLTGKLNIEEFVSLIANAALVIGNDTGGIHIAALSGVPTLVICGQGQFGDFHPYPHDNINIPEICRPNLVALPLLPCHGCCWQCCYSQTPKEYCCIRQIPVETAVAELRKIVAKIQK